MTDGWRQILAESPGVLPALLRKTLDADLRAALDAIETRDNVRLVFIAHRLKGSARLLGDAQATALCASLEATAQAGDTALARLLLMRTRRALASALRRLDPP